MSSEKRGQPCPDESKKEHHKDHPALYDAHMEGAKEALIAAKTGFTEGPISVEGITGHRVCIQYQTSELLNLRMGQSISN